VLYYELEIVRLGKGALIQFGFATPAFEVGVHKLEEGVGDDALSVGVDGIGNRFSFERDKAFPIFFVLLGMALVHLMPVEIGEILDGPLPEDDKVGRQHVIKRGFVELIKNRQLVESIGSLQ